jgi:hypothetical protein
MFIRLYSLFKSDEISTNIKLTLYKALIRSVMTYDCPTWEFAADTRLMKLQLMQNRVLSTIDKFMICVWLSKFCTYMII